MNNWPELKQFAADINTMKIDRRNRVAGSIAYLSDRAADVRLHNGVDELAEVAFDEVNPDKKAKTIAYHLEQVRNAMATKLWANEILVGVTVLDEMLFDHIAAGETNPVLATLQSLRESELSRLGMVIFPLHSFGLLGAGLMRPLRGTSPYVINKVERFAVTPQTNKIERTVAVLDEVGSALGVGKPVDPELIEHWRQSRGARWLERNPLLIVAMTALSRYYYENEFLLLGRLRMVTSAMVLLAALQPRREERAAGLFSSSKVNNWQTLDIHHYIVLSDQRRRSLLHGAAVPIHNQRRVSELSDLAIDVDPRYWHRRAATSRAVYEAARDLYAGYLRHSVGTHKEDALGRTYRKLFEAMTYFRRSYHGEGETWSAVVSLATAFEMLLTDAYQPGVRARLVRRTAVLLKGVRGTRRYQAAVEGLYEARSITVHLGREPRLDLYDARQAFVLVLIELMRRMHTLADGETQPLTFLTGVP